MSFTKTESKYIFEEKKPKLIIQKRHLGSRTVTVRVPRWQQPLGTTKFRLRTAFYFHHHSVTLSFPAGTSISLPHHHNNAPPPRPAVTLIKNLFKKGTEFFTNKNAAFCLFQTDQDREEEERLKRNRRIIIFIIYYFKLFDFYFDLFTEREREREMRK